MNSRFVAYYRVSTSKQGNSGLGLDAQKKSVADYLNGASGKLVDEFVEVESGKNCNRVEFENAVKACRAKNAVLIVAKLDRLSRNVHFLTGLREAGIEFVCCDMPSANSFTVNVYAALAEEECRLISERTRAGLAAARARGIKLGKPENLNEIDKQKGRKIGLEVRKQKAKEFFNNIVDVVRSLKNSRLSLQKIAIQLNSDGYSTRRGGRWHSNTVKRIIDSSTAAMAT